MPPYPQLVQTDFYIQVQDLIIIPHCFHFCKILPVSAFWIRSVSHMLTLLLFLSYLYIWIFRPPTTLLNRRVCNMVSSVVGMSVEKQ